MWKEGIPSIQKKKGEKYHQCNNSMNRRLQYKVIRSNWTFKKENQYNTMIYSSIEHLCGKPIEHSGTKPIEHSGRKPNEQ